MNKFISQLWQQRYPDVNLADNEIKEIYIKSMDVILLIMEWKYRNTKKEAINNSLLTKESISKDVQPKERLIPVSKWNNYYDYPPIGGLRSLIFNAKNNGFNKVIRRIGRRVLINENKFFEWVEETNKNFHM